MRPRKSDELFPEKKEVRGQDSTGPSSRPAEWGRKMRERGFTFIEVLLVVAIIGILALVSYPNIKNSLEVRGLENEAREVLTTLQQAKFQAVKFRLNHRVNFDNSLGYWVYFIEREESYDKWVEVRRFMRKSIPNKFAVTINLPNQHLGFTPLGQAFMDKTPDEILYSATQNDISLQSPNVQRQGQPSTRTIVIYAGGSVQYTKST
jgi:prepilin-type N-terminal cleavage/methylation domain-containing protein